MTSCHGFNRFLEFCIHIRIVENCLRVNTNIVIDNKFKPGQTHPGIWQLRKFKGQLRIAYVHHDFDRRHGHFTGRHFGHLCFEQPVVHVPGIAFRA